MGCEITKFINTIAFVAMLLLASTTGASTADTVVIRGPVAQVMDGCYVLGPQEFAGFYYDIDEDIGTESITLTITDYCTLDDWQGVVYTTEAQKKDIKFGDWGEYWSIRFLGEEYFAGYVEADIDLRDNSYLYCASVDENLMVDEQLSKILIDDDEERILVSGTPLKLEGGYELNIEGIDPDGKVWLELSKGGDPVDSALIQPSLDAAMMEDETYIYAKDVGDTRDIVVIAVHIKGVKQNQVAVDGIWQISDTPTDIEEDTEYGKMTIQMVDCSEPMKIAMSNEDNKITLSKNKDVILMEDIRIKTADQDYIGAENPLRFYIYKEISDPGTYEIRSPVVSVVDGEYTLDASNFAGFYYDIDDNCGVEQIYLGIEDESLREDCGLVYTTSAQLDDFDFDVWGLYYAISFLGEKYFAGYAEEAPWLSSCENGYLYGDSTDTNLMVDEQLCKVLYNDDEERSLTSDNSLKLKEGYELAIKAIDEDSNILLELFKDGSLVDSTVISPYRYSATVEDKTYTYKKNLGDTEDIVIIAIHFKGAIFRGASIGLQDMAIVNGIWQISDTPIPIEEDTKYDKMTIQSVDADYMSVEMTNEDERIALDKNQDISLMGNFRIKTADQTITAEDPLRFYIYEEVTIAGGE